MELDKFDIEILGSIVYILEQHKQQRPADLLKIVIKKAKAKKE